ncbi:hypothetical protein GALL_314190 [mine drainage metagenome]|uniref:Uncharacterized protein n=1 Tax=mine drainage metagenome TaxID=410659 RepID=A0A1J5RAN4_9ZZZZ
MYANSAAPSPSRRESAVMPGVDNLPMGLAHNKKINICEELEIIGKDGLDNNKKSYATPIFITRIPGELFAGGGSACSSSSSCCGSSRTVVDEQFL